MASLLVQMGELLMLEPPDELVQIKHGEGWMETRFKNKRRLDGNETSTKVWPCLLQTVAKTCGGQNCSTAMME
jgi:hypothetical protein